MEIKKLISQNPEIIEIGSGKYGTVFRFKRKQKIINRILFKKEKDHYFVIKQIIIKNNHNNVKNEIMIHKFCYENNKLIFLKIYDGWIEFNNYSINNKFNENIYIAYFMLDYMNRKDFMSYLLNNSNRLLIKREKINIETTLFIIIYSIYYLHNILNIYHGDLTLSNIFINKINTQKIKFKYNDKNLLLNTNGFEVKVGDFSITNKIRTECKYIKRDYIILEQLYNKSHLWFLMTDEITFKLIKHFLKKYIIDIFTKDPLFYINYNQFWNKKSNIINEKILYYKYPQILLDEYVKLYNKIVHLKLNAG